MTNPPWVNLVEADTHARLLIEALRRWYCFAVRRDNRKLSALEYAWLGLGTRNTGYGRLERFGLMRIAPGVADNSPHLSWWSVTPRGGLILRRWIRQGFWVPPSSYERVVHRRDPALRPMIPRSYLRTPKESLHG